MIDTKIIIIETTISSEINSRKEGTCYALLTSNHHRYRSFRQPLYAYISKLISTLLPLTFRSYMHVLGLLT